MSDLINSTTVRLLDVVYFLIIAFFVIFIFFVDFCIWRCLTLKIGLCDFSFRFLCTHTQLKNVKGNWVETQTKFNHLSKVNRNVRATSINHIAWATRTSEKEVNNVNKVFCLIWKQSWSSSPFILFYFKEQIFL